MIETQFGPIYEPVHDESRMIYDWLVRFQHALDGSRAYEDMVKIYQALEFDLSQQNKRHVG